MALKKSPIMTVYTVLLVPRTGQRLTGFCMDLLISGINWTEAMRNTRDEYLWRYINTDVLAYFIPSSHSSTTHLQRDLISLHIMKFSAIAASASFFLVAMISNVNAAALDVFVPPIISSKAGAVWTSGQQQVITWFMVISRLKSPTLTNLKLLGILLKHQLTLPTRSATSHFAKGTATPR